MHIAFYAPTWPPQGAANGIVSYISQIRDELVGLGHDVSVITFEGVFSGASASQKLIFTPDIKSRIKIALHKVLDRLDQGTTSSAQFLSGIVKALNSYKPIDVLEIEESFGWTEAVANTGVRVVTRLHGPHFWQQEATAAKWSKTRERAEGRAIKKAKYISAPTTAVLNATLSRYGPSSNMTAVIPNPVKTAAVNDRWSFASADPAMVLWVGQFTRRKGPDLLLSAFSQVFPHRPGLSLHMVGPDKGFEDVEGRVWRFSEYAREHLSEEVARRIHFHGILEPSEIAELRRRATLTVCTSRAEVAPYSILEAMACGSPVVSTQWLGVDELLMDRVTGWIAHPESYHSLASKMLEVLDNPLEAGRIAEAGFRRCAEVFSPSSVARNLLAYYQKVTTA